MEGISYVDTTVSVVFEGIKIHIKHTKWIGNPHRSPSLSFCIYNEKRESIPNYSSLHDFIVKKFKESEMFKCIEEKYINV